MHRTILPVVACALVLAAAPARAERFSAELVGFEEIPALLSEGKGTLTLDLDRRAQTLTFTLEFSGLSAPVTQSHIHFGKRHVAGSIFVFFCSNLANPPAGTQPCPAGGGTVTGTITAANLLAIVAQGFPAGNFDALTDALDSDTAYANVHTTNFPAGEIRGQIRHGRGHRDHDRD
jgi:CHRD domain-containing protein